MTASAPPSATVHVHTNRQTRSLSLSTSLIQSCMRLDDPDTLVLDYTRTMMGFLLLHPAPRSVLMVGLGGGSMAKYIHRHLPTTHLTVVELLPEVIAERDAFAIPPDDARLRIVCADGSQHVRQAGASHDVILLDAFDGQGIPPALCTRGFYEACRRALTPDGVLVVNVQADTDATREIVARIRKAFGTGVLEVESDEGGNTLVTAGALAGMHAADAAFESRWAALPPVHQTTLAVSSVRLQRALARLRGATSLPSRPFTEPTS